MSGNGNAAEVLELAQRWAAAEQHNDAGLLSGLLADDFVGVGAVGFVLTRDQWLGRFQGGLDNRRFARRTRRSTTTAAQWWWLGPWSRRRASRDATTPADSGSDLWPCARRIAGFSPVSTSDRCRTPRLRPRDDGRDGSQRDVR